MIIILEGPDGSGKSTLAETLAEETGYEVYHSGNPKTAEELVANSTKCEELIAKGDIIIDRLPVISEIVYSTAFDREVRMKVDGKITELTKTPGEKWMLVYCNPDLLDPKTGKAHKTQEWQDKVKGSLELIRDLYDQIIGHVAELYKDQVIQYDYSKDKDLEFIIKRIRDNIRDEKKSQESSQEES